MDEQMEIFLKSIDPGLCAYANQLLKYAVTSDNTLRFLRPSEVQKMDIPSVFKRMLISKIIDLQTPDSKRKLKMKEEDAFSLESDTAAGRLPPKKLKYDEDCEKTAPETKSSTSTSTTTLDKEIDRLKDERDCLRAVIYQKKDELSTLKSSPVPTKPLPIPGLPIINVVCDNCHHRGHRVCGNKGGQKCPYVQCSGFHYCGIEGKHKEYRQEVSEAEKEIQSLEKKLKDIETEITGMNSFIKHNNSSFIASVRPKLLISDVTRYKGKDGNNNLQRDIRLIKIATGGKIPTEDSKESFQKLIALGKEKLVDSGVCNEHTSNENTNNNMYPDFDKLKFATNLNSSSNVGNSSSNVGCMNMTSPIPNPYYQPMYTPVQGMVGYPINQAGFGSHSASFYGFPNAQYNPICDFYGTQQIGILQTPACASTSKSQEVMPPLPKESPPKNPPLPPADDK